MNRYGILLDFANRESAYMNTVHYGWRDGKNTVISLVMVTEKLTSQMKLHPQKKNGVIFGVATKL